MIKDTFYPAVTTIAAGRYDRNDCTKSGLYQIMIMEENSMKYPENIMRMVRGNLELELDDTSLDGEIEAMSKREVFDRVCSWDGLINYGDTIVKWINQIYGIDLNKIDK